MLTEAAIALCVVFSPPLADCLDGKSEKLSSQMRAPTIWLGKSAGLVSAPKEAFLLLFGDGASQGKGSQELGQLGKVMEA